MALLAFALILVFAMIAIPSFGVAGDTRSANEIEIAANELITDDLYLAGRTVNFLGQAERDVSIVAGRAEVAGTIAGSVNLATGQSDVTGTIDGTLRILSGRVEISGDVGGDVIMAGGQLVLTSSGVIGGNLLAAGGEIDVRGKVNGDISGYAMNTTIGGTVLGKVDISTTEMNILNTARITGPVSYTSRKEADVSANAQLAQGIEQDKVDPWGDGENPLGRASGTLLRTMWALIAGALIVIAAPRLANQLGSNGKRILMSLMFGVIALIMVPIVAIALMTTIAGIPAGIILITLFFVALYLTQVFVGMSIGRFILPSKWNDGSRGFHLLAMTIGVILIGALRFVPLPYVSPIMTLIITIWGIGAVLMLLGSLNRQKRTAAA